MAACWRSYYWVSKRKEVISRKFRLKLLEEVSVGRVWRQFG